MIRRPPRSTRTDHSFPTRRSSDLLLRDLCTDSGLSVGGLYAYIKNKDDLTHLIQSHGFILTRRTMLAHTLDVPYTPDKLFAAVRAHLYLDRKSTRLNSSH